MYLLALVLIVVLVPARSLGPRPIGPAVARPVAMLVTTGTLCLIVAQGPCPVATSSSKYVPAVAALLLL